MMKLITKKHSLVTCKLRMAGQLKDVPPKWLILYVMLIGEIYVAVRKSVKSAQPPRQSWEEESCRRTRDPQRTVGVGLDRVECARSDGRMSVRCEKI